MRLIDADALIENKFKNDISYIAFVSLVKRQPTIDPVKRGRWETEVRTIHGHKIPFFACSVCGKNADDEYNYCPNCGARMEGEDDDSD